MRGRGVWLLVFVVLAVLLAAVAVLVGDIFTMLKVR